MSDNIVLHSLALEEAQKASFLETFTVKFYVWAIGCSLYVDNISARVRGDNALLWHSEPPTITQDIPLYQRPLPTEPLEMVWASLLQRVESEAGSGDAWMWTSLLRSFNSTGRISDLEASLGRLTALSYALVAQYLSTTTIQKQDGSQYWNAVNATISGHQSILFAHLRVNPFPVVLGSLAVLLLMAASVCYTGLRRNPDDNINWDGGVIDVITLMHGSSLPAIIAGNPHSVEDSRRERSECTDIK